MLEYDPRKRITANDALKHPYFKPVVNRMVKFNSSKDIILLSADKYKTSYEKYFSSQLISSIIDLIHYHHYIVHLVQHPREVVQKIVLDVIIVFIL